MFCSSKKTSPFLFSCTIFVLFCFHHCHLSYSMHVSFSTTNFPSFFLLVPSLLHSQSLSLHPSDCSGMASPGINIKALHNSTAASIMNDAMSHFGREAPSLSSFCLCKFLSLCLAWPSSARWSQPALVFSFMKNNGSNNEHEGCMSDFQIRSLKSYVTDKTVPSLHKMP